MVSVPSRGFCFRTRRKRVWKDRASAAVSVPSRGFCFRTLIPSVAINQPFPSRFRPLTGILFSNGESILYEGFVLPASFRPLTGILFSNLHSIFQPTAVFLAVFPSPHGDFVFELILVEAAVVLHMVEVSVPSRGFCFRTDAVLRNRLRKPAGFRPLTGILFSNQSAKSRLRRRR